VGANTYASIKYFVFIRSTYTEPYTTLLHRQGEEPTVKGTYNITTTIYLGTIQQHPKNPAAAQ
jgi:hypothetical protein